MRVGVAKFSSVHGAERAYADAHGRGAEPDWVADAVVVEVHRNGRIVVRGTVAGRYVDVDGRADAIGHDTGAGAIAGAAIGFVLGPPAFAVGVVGGATAGGAAQARHLPRQHGAAFDAIREQVPEDSSAIVVFSDDEGIRAMSRALATEAGELVHYRLAPEAEAELRSYVADAPAAAPPSSH